MKQQCAEKDCYIKFGKEVAPQTGTNHLQGYVVMKDKRFMTGVKKIVCNSAHIELMLGTIAQNDKYVEKEGDFYELGDDKIRKNSEKNYGPHFDEISACKQAWESDSDEAFEDFFPTLARYPPFGPTSYDSEQKSFIRPRLCDVSGHYRLLLSFDQNGGHQLLGCQQ